MSLPIALAAPSTRRVPLLTAPPTRRAPLLTAPTRRAPPLAAPPTRRAPVLAAPPTRGAPLLAARPARPRRARPAAARPAPLRDDAAGALVERHLGLARALACQLIRTGAAGQLELDELVSLGTVALLEAARRFDPTHGARFSTFAYPRLRGAMIDGVAELAPVKRSTYRASRRHQAAGRPALEIGSLEAMLERGQEPAVEDVDPAASLDRARQHRAIAAAVAALPERKRRFVEGHYAGERDLKEIGVELGLSKSWSSRLHAQTLADLRRALGAPGAATAADDGPCT